MSVDSRVGEDQSARMGPVGLGGWLILPLLGIALTPVISTVLQWSHLQAIFEAWSVVSTAQKLFLIIDLAAIGVACFIAPAVLLYLAFQRSEMFPGLYIIWICALPVMLLVEGFATLWVFSDLLTSEEVFDRETRRDIGRSIFQAILWTVYMNRSKRVANTFVN